MLHLPFVTARLEVAVPPPEADLRLGPVAIPTPRKAAYYVGLGTLAAVEVIEWPIAVALAAGSYVAQRARLSTPSRGGSSDR